MENASHKGLFARTRNRILHIIARVSPGSRKVRPFLHRLRGVRIGRGVFVGDDVYLENEYPERIEIEDNVELGLRSVVLAHLRGPGKVLIKKNAWIGPCCLIASANGRTLTIGEGAVIGACSVITTDVADHAFTSPAPAERAATASVPLATAGSYIEFLQGLRPARPRGTGRNRAAAGEGDRAMAQPETGIWPGGSRVPAKNNHRTPPVLADETGNSAEKLAQGAAIEAAVWRAIDRVNELLADAQQLRKNRGTLLLEAGTVLDSMALVNLLVFIEDEVKSSFGKEIALAGESGASPLGRESLRTLGSLIDVLDGLLADAR